MGDFLQHQRKLRGDGGTSRVDIMGRKVAGQIPSRYEWQEGMLPVAIRDELLLQSRLPPEEIRENSLVQEDIDHAWMALNLCVREKKSFYFRDGVDVFGMGKRKTWRRIRGRMFARRRAAVRSKITRMLTSLTRSYIYSL